MSALAPAVAVVTLGCGRNEVDSDQVTGSLQAAGFTLVDDAGAADCVLVNTCTFIEPARQESIDEILAAHDFGGGRVPVVAIGCMAQRYGDELAEALPEAAAVVGFADYPRLPDIVARLLGGAPARPGPALLPLATSGTAAAKGPNAPPTASFPVRTVPRGPWAYLKIAGGCDRRCTFCTIPSYRGRFASRPIPELVAEARWLVGNGVRELICVSENTTSWGKDLPGGRHAQAELIAAFETVDGLERVRLMYLQPAELSPRLLEAMAASPVVASYYDLSLQHASPHVVARMGRSGGAERFAELIAGIRRRDPTAVFRSSFIVGFPGETEADVDILQQFIEDVGLDWMGFFAYSPEDGTLSAVMPDQVPADVTRARLQRLTEVAERVAADRSERFVGQELDVLVESHDAGDALGRSYREAPESDGEVRLPGCLPPVGRMLGVQITASSGVDLAGRPLVPAGMSLVR